jgi:RHH-type transcriptional regulator, proline utilization regulon repressor / proline dehydrogenase / delta 1-pyrroline-5-carboxylate dehydrogenase
MLSNSLFNAHSLRQNITHAYRMDETECVEQLLKQISFSPDAQERIHATAQKLVIETRAQHQQQGTVTKLLQQYNLSSDEGIALMCLAEALLRIPDQYTRDLLISDKISTINWLAQTDKEKSLFANATSWSLLLTGKVFSPSREKEKGFLSALKRTISSPGLVALRPIIMQGMKLIGNQFVTGQTIEEALTQAQKLQEMGYRFSYDMLGEAARTKEDADRYFDSYKNAIIAIGKSAPSHDPIKSPGISIKLSALHPRYEYSNHQRVMAELVPSLLELIKLAKQYNIGVTIDAEEADRLDISLDIFEKVFSQPELASWEGLGLVVQAYQKRATHVIDWLTNLSRQYKRRIMLRLVKGAYWDAEIKQSQVFGLEGYPVFTRKPSTDLSYLVCAKKLLENLDCFFPQFGTHNAYSVAAILEMGYKTPSSGNPPFEFQCLHGMGRPLYDQIVDKNQYHLPTRIYAPVGSHTDLVGYLIRRLLENGANSSFINNVANEKIPLEEVIINPISKIAKETRKPHPAIPLPRDIYGNRKNSSGIDLSNRSHFNELKQALDKVATKSWVSAPLLNGKLIKNNSAQTVVSPVDGKPIGETYKASEKEAEEALRIASEAKKDWEFTPVEERASILERAADIFQEEMPSLITLLTREGGKAIPDSISEIRETIDFCRYYAQQARLAFQPQILPGPTGESNQLSLHPRGIILCISPWNFPLAIFTGQVTAALACGNAVIAKPAEQTTLIAAEAIRILHQAGIPKEILHLVPGKGSVIGSKLVADNRISGIMFTGSTETAQTINQTLAARKGPIVPLIAETGGQNAMIVDSSALAEQVVLDIMQSAFNSAGQRCSALRVLFVQEDIAPRLLSMLKGAMAELNLNLPHLLATDIGPVIDQDALNTLKQHVDRMKKEARLVYEMPAPHGMEGSYFQPCAFELNDLTLLPREVFGPILHIIRFKADELNKVIDMISETGYGLTLGIHSRIESTINYVVKRMPVGNIYINRNIVGAVVGVQPFGGEGLSGTGPKAGGPHYLPRLCVERAVSNNTTAIGGNTTLVMLQEEVNA